MKTKEQQAEEYADGTTPFGDHGGNNWRAAYNGYLAALNARDEEVERLQSRTKQLRAELEEAKNPWRKTEDKLPPSPKGYYHEWVLVKMDKRDDTPFTAFYKKKIDTWFTEGEFGYKEIARPDVWMPIPETPKVKEK